MTVRMLAAVAVVVGMAAIAPDAHAAQPASLTLDQSQGTSAGQMVPFGTTANFGTASATEANRPTGFTLSLPPGLLADASIDAGACLNTATPTAACQVGTGTVKAAVEIGAVWVTQPQPVNLYLVKPPKAGDLAGLAITSAGSQIGSPGDITVRPSNDPAGVGLNITMSFPSTYSGLPLAVQQVTTNLSAMRMPTACPSPSAKVSLSASYADSSTASATAPLTVSGCSSLRFSPGLRVSAVKDISDTGVQVTADLTQTSGQATPRTVALTLPPSVLAPNPAVLSKLCTSPTFSGCQSVGSVTSTSLLYPVPLSGRAYLTRYGSSLELALEFPPPLALKLVGAVNIATGSTAFTGVPDIPQSDLKVTLNRIFRTGSSCSGTGRATLTPQVGGPAAKTVSSPPFTVRGCTSRHPAPRVASPSLSGLASGHPVLTFRFTSVTSGSKVTSFRVVLPRGLSFIRRARGHRHRTTVTLRGARVKSIRFSHGHLIVTLRKPASSFSVTIRNLAATAGLEQRVKHHHTKHLKVTIIVKDSAGGTRRETVAVRNLH